MLHRTTRNVSYIRRLLARGFAPGTVANRCAERLTWDGPLPIADDIERFIESDRPKIPSASPTYDAR